MTWLGSRFIFRTGPHAGPSVWAAQLPAEVADVPALRLDGQRVVRARHPNGNPETMGLHTQPTGWAAGAANWLPGRAARGPATPPVTVMVRTPNRSSAYAVFPFYQTALGGICNGLFTPNVSFWCNPDNPRDGAHGVWNGTGGLQYNASTLNGTAAGSWTNATRAVVHVWHHNHWATQMFDVATHDPTAQTLTWGNGGFQDARAANQGAEWYVENVFELLDAPNEYYFAPETHTLYLYYNGTGPPPTQLVVPQLATLIDIAGTPGSPVRNVTLANLTLTDTPPTFMQPHGVPSAGDWALQASGVVRAEGSEHLQLDGLNLTRVDGNGVMLLGYHRFARITNCTFMWIGGTAMAAWGATDQLSANGTQGFNASDGRFPRYTTVAHNVASELGLYEKQSAAWFQAKSMQTVLQHNVFFNGPRAGVVFNDGFGGGNVMESNLLFNFCRESGDHGPFNSWDRQMFVVRQPDDAGAPSPLPQYNNLTRNMLVANYQAQDAVDTDDGSAFFHTTDNLLVYGVCGQKADLAGHDNKHVGNIYAYVAGACYCDLGGGEPTAAHRNTHRNNTCVVGGATAYASINCRDNASWPVLADNTIYNPTGTTTVCGLPFAQWQALGHDAGTRLHAGWPSTDELLRLAATKLRLH